MNKRLRISGKRPRRGVFVMLTVIVIIVTASLLTAFTRSLVTQAKQSRMRLRHRQATRLAEAGVERARIRLQASPDYEGETWTTEASGGLGEVVITLRRESGRQTVRVVSRFPTDVTEPATAERQNTILDTSTERDDEE